MSAARLPTPALDPALPAASVEALRIRPVRRSDEEGLREMIGRCSPDDLRLRCFGVCKGFARSFADRLARLAEGGPEFAAVAVLPRGGIGGVVHASGRPGAAGGVADYDILVRTDLKGRGIGTRLMRAMLREAGRRGFRAVGGEVLLGNRAMLLLAADLGFRRVAVDGGVVRVELRPPHAGDRAIAPGDGARGPFPVAAPARSAA